MAQLAPRRYVFPSIITCLAVAILPAALLGLLIAEMNSSSWDTNGDSGASTGAVIFALEALVMVAYAALVFPLVGFWLQHLGHYRRVTFLVANAVGLLLVSLGVAALVCFTIFGSGSVYLRQLAIILVQVAVLCLPFAFLWLRLAK